jgi:hypothetical protein
MYQCKEAYGGMEVHLNAFLTSVLDGVSVFFRFIAKKVYTAGSRTKFFL